MSAKWLRGDVKQIAEESAGAGQVHGSEANSEDEDRKVLMDVAKAWTKGNSNWEENLLNEMLDNVSLKNPDPEDPEEEVTNLPAFQKLKKWDLLMREAEPLLIPLKLS